MDAHSAERPAADLAAIRARSIRTTAGVFAWLTLISSGCALAVHHGGSSAGVPVGVIGPVSLAFLITAVCDLALLFVFTAWLRRR
jgi:hypothetical protein